MPQILRRRYRPRQIGGATDPALQTPGFHRSAAGRRPILPKRVSDHQGLARGYRDALSIDGIEGAVRVADR